MRKWAMLFVLASAGWPVFAEKPAVTQQVTVEQLEQVIANTHSGKRDRRLARQISDLKLTERLSAVRFSRLERELHGGRAKEALLALADESEFLDLPVSEVSSKPAPAPAEQAAMLGLSVESVKKTIAGWPNFIATRKTIRFEGTAAAVQADLQDALFSYDSERAPPGANWECPGKPKIGRERMGVIDRSSVTVVNRNGRELHALDERGGEFECPENGVSTTEEFGRVLSWIPRIVAEGSVVWSHWEQGTSGFVAVFRYSARISHRSIPIDVYGEIALDPADESIRRLTQIRHWTKHEPASGSRAAYDRAVEYDSAVDYGPVVIGGATYICPVKRVAVYRAPILWPRGANSQGDEIYRKFGLAESPLQEYLNDVTFTQYRLYGSS